MVDRFALNWRRADLDGATEELLAFAESLTLTPGLAVAERIADLRTAGWDGRAISDAAQVCAFFNYINRIADGLGIEMEDWIDELGYETG
ncbi:MAG: hypothetical protein ACE5E8_00575 [Acidimicrobiia bacterium]